MPVTAPPGFSWASPGATGSPGRRHLASGLRLSPFPALVSLRRAAGPATGPLIRPGRDLLPPRGNPFFAPATPATPACLPPYRSWWFIRVLCGEAEFEACQVAGSLPVQRGAVPVGVQPEEVERAGHVHVVEAGFRQAAVAGAPCAVAGGLVHGALHAGAAAVGDAVIAAASRRDLADALAAVVMTDGHDNVTYNLSGDTDFTYADIAQAMSIVLEREVSYTPVTPDELRSMLVGSGMGEAMAGFLVSLDEPIAAGMFAKAGDDLTRLTARPTTTLVDGLTGR
jgi:hypothetical protein